MIDVKEIMEMKDLTNTLISSVLISLLGVGPKAWKDADSMLVEIKCPKEVKDMLKLSKEVLTISLSDLESETFNLLIMMGLTSLVKKLDFEKNKAQLTGRLLDSIRYYEKHHNTSQER